MNIDALLEDYMNNPKWAGKIFMQDEKTCYIDGFNNGVSSCQSRITQLTQHIEKMKCCANCKYGEQGEYDFFENCRSCTAMYCICQKTKKEMDWTDKCDEWELAK